MNATRVGRLALLLLAVVALAPPAAGNPLVARNSIGGGTVSGTATCDADGLTLDATAKGFIFNTVIVGHVGNIDIDATGPGCTSTTVTMSANGVGPTGSRLICPSLVGPYATDGVTVHIEVVGQCRINNFPADVRWRFEAATGFTGTFTIERV